MTKSNNAISCLAFSSVNVQRNSQTGYNCTFTLPEARSVKRNNAMSSLVCSSAKFRRIKQSIYFTGTFI